MSHSFFFNRVFQWFLMSLSVRPGICAAMRDHLRMIQKEYQLIYFQYIHIYYSLLTTLNYSGTAGLLSFVQNGRVPRLHNSIDVHR